MSKEMVSIRMATPEDAEAIAIFSRQAFFDTFAPFNTKENMDKFLKEQFGKEMLMAETGDERNIFLAAETGGALTGYALMRETENPPELGDARAIEIVRIYAGLQCVGKGVGSALMDKCISIAREKRKELVWLCVWEHNRRAIDFYLKKGFERFGVRLFMLGDDPQNDWMMKKII